MKRFLTNQNLSPIIGIFLVVLVLFFLNYKPGTFLTGWDNLHPEFNAGLALKRSIFAVWQEYQSLGLLGGMGHATDFVHTITTGLLSFIFPLNAIRYAWTFLMLFLGGIGTYFLIQKIVTSKTESALPAFVGGVFYMLNLATLQTFYAPFESFVAHFAALPWLILTSLLYIKSPDKKHAILLAVVLLLASPAAYIPTLFVVYILTLLVLIGVGLWQTETKSVLMRNSAKLFGIIFAVNAFWLLPFLYFTITNAGTNVTSKINQMATDTIFAQNKEFGTIPDVMLLKGFWFQNVDPDFAGDRTFMLTPLRIHYDIPLVVITGFLLFSLVATGIFITLKRKDKTLYPFLALFLFAFTMLATATIPFSWFDTAFRQLPFFNQAFRFPFTKFSILTSLTYSIFAAYATVFLIQYFKRFAEHLSKILVPTVILILLIFSSLPVFYGNFFYQKETIKIPQEYFQVFDYFKKEDPSARIANFPQQSFWGWNFYSWGYGGSGFLWHGIEQPILDRAFDVWSVTSEQYYFELTNALYSKDVAEFKNVLNKYQVSFLLVDTNIINPQNPKVLFVHQLEEIIAKIPEISKTASFGNIGIYKMKLGSKPKTFTYAVKNMSSVSPVINQNNDLAFKTFGDYYSDIKNSNSITYPFSPLFSKKSEKDLKITPIEKEDFVEISSIIPPHTDIRTLSIASFSATENIIPILLSLKVDAKNTTTITSTITTPVVSIEGRKIYGEDIEFPIFVLPADTTYPLTINVNGLRNFEVSNSSQAQRIIVSSFLTLGQNNSITLSSPDGFSKTYIITSDLLKSFNVTRKEISIPPSANPQKITLLTPKVKDEYLNFEKDNFADTSPEACNEFRKGTSSFDISDNSIVLNTRNTSSCLAFPIPNLLHDQGYTIFVNAKNTKGQSLHFWALNEDGKIAPVDTYLDKKNETHTFILPKMEENGQGYSLHFDNESIGQDTSINSISRIALFHIPFNLLTNITLSTKTPSNSKSAITTESLIDKVEHPNVSQYIVRLKKPLDQNEVLILSQSYNAGWAAYEIVNSKWLIVNRLKTAFPFFLGTKLDKHVMVNNWSNGWSTNKSSTPIKSGSIVIVYLPQYLQYLGFAILILLPSILLFNKLRFKK